jgi:methylated-DNA-[protein]-cysteine S-methyltransferase
MTLVESSLRSPVGKLRIVADGGRIVALDWERTERDDSSPLLREAMRQLDAYFAGRLREFDLPLAPAGSVFQRNVWAAMLRIPFGATRSYGELAAELGSAARAVGGACGSNPIPVVIPCHRVLGARGAMGGYSGRGGLATKRRLLSLEGAIPATLAL